MGTPGIEWGWGRNIIVPHSAQDAPPQRAIAPNVSSEGGSDSRGREGSICTHVSVVQTLGKVLEPLI